MYNYDGTNFRGITRIEGERRRTFLCAQYFDYF